MENGGVMWSNMSYLEKARYYDEMLKEEELTAYQYARIQGKNMGSITTYTKFLKFSEDVLKVLESLNLSMHKANPLLKLAGKKSDAIIIKIIKFVVYKKFNIDKVKKLVEKELRLERYDLDKSKRRH